METISRQWENMTMIGYTAVMFFIQWLVMRFCRGTLDDFQANGQFDEASGEKVDPNHNPNPNPNPNPN